MSILPASTETLKPTELFVLAVLRDGPLHGYGIVQEVAARSGGRLKLRPGNLYRVLDRMLERGLIDIAGTRGQGDDRRTDYRITPLGRKTAQAEAKLLSLVLSDLLAT